MYIKKKQPTATGFAFFFVVTKNQNYSIKYDLFFYEIDYG